MFVFLYNILQSLFTAATLSDITDPTVSLSLYCLDFRRWYFLTTNQARFVNDGQVMRKK